MSSLSPNLYEINEGKSFLFLSLLSFTFVRIVPSTLSFFYFYGILSRLNESTSVPQTQCLCRDGEVTSTPTCPFQAVSVITESLQVENFT